MNSSTTHNPDPTWHLIDAQGQVVGRLATEIALLLRGKNKVTFVPYKDCGDHVVVINAADLQLTGNKMETKQYHRHSGYPGGLKTTSVKQLTEEKPEKVIEAAVKGMLPRTKLHTVWMKRLHVYPHQDHPHQANLAGTK